jgi:hypothetical protein
MGATTKLALAFFFASSPGLVPMDYQTKPPSDWPKLDERITYIPQESVARFCRVSKDLTDRVQGCTTIDFYYNLCMIHLGNKSPELLAHEREHCQGYDHEGDGGKSIRAWEAFKAKGTGNVYQQPFIEH